MPFKLGPLLRSGYRAKERAQELGVSVSAIRRDMAALLAQGTIAVVPRW
jgi:predicted ArsR family transcriptional regulator